MAPRKGKKKVKQVVKTRKIVEETVEVSIVGSETQAQTPTKLSEKRDEHSTVTTKTIPIEDDDETQNLLTQETETEEPEFLLDDPIFERVSTPPREEARSRQDEPLNTDETQNQHSRPNKRARKDESREQYTRPNKRTRKSEALDQNSISKQGQVNISNKLVTKDESRGKDKTVPKKEIVKAKPQNKVKKKKGRKSRMREMGEGREGYKSYIFKVLKQVHPGLGVSGKAMTVINNFICDMFERLANESSRLCMYANKQTLSSREMQGAVMLVLPGELGKHAIAEGTKAVTNYVNYGI